MPDNPDFITVHVDFNNLDQHGRFRTLQTHADKPSALQPGAPVLLWDEEGNMASGRVVELTERAMVVIEMTPGTWRNRRDEVRPMFVVLDAGIFAVTRSATSASGVAVAPAMTAPTSALVPKVVAA